MLALEFIGELSGVKELGITDTEAQPFFFTFKVECGSCREIHSNTVGFNAHEKHPLANSRGGANFVMKCKSCGKEGNVNVVEAPAEFGVFDAKKNNGRKPARLVTFNCRGLNLVEFIPDGEFWATGEESNTKFSVTFDDGEWYDYDEKAGQDVSITECDWTIVKTK